MHITKIAATLGLVALLAACGGGGGGGGGGYAHGVFAVTPTTPYTVTVGGPGSGNGSADMGGSGLVIVEF